MFERRLKIFLSLLFAFTLVLIVRAAQLQIVRRNQWTEQAADAMKRVQLIETTRGTLRDCKGDVLAIDVACIDACVDYRALTDPPDELWVANLAQQRIRQRRALEFRHADVSEKKTILDEEKQNVLDRIGEMWKTLAELSGQSVDDIDGVRRDIVRRVEVARRYQWYHNFKLASDAHDKKAEDHPSSKWLNWLSGGNDSDAPRLDDFDVKVAEQTEAHPIVHAISSDVQLKLGKNLDDYPGLVLRPGMTRSYPYKDIACHVIGNVSRVRAQDIKRDPEAEDELRKYEYTDLVGRTGLEALCEPVLRGTRGRIEHYLGDNSAGSDVTLAPQPGKDISATIDMDLQQQVLELFQNARVDFKSGTGDAAVEVPKTISVHGGAVLIDLRSGQVRALVSNPTYDLNTLETELSTLMSDNLNRPLLNRATQYPLEPGSTIKPVIGIGAISQGVLGVNEGIECTGNLMIHGKRANFGRCWVASKWGWKLGENVGHHPIPNDAPHRGHDGNPDGFLTFSDGLERSCNIFFETVGHRLGLQGMSYWMDQFGLGRPTGIGIGEWRGTLPDSYDGPDVEYATYISGIGQSPVSATTIQMANVSATVARGGTWMRPTLLTTDVSNDLRKILRARSIAHPSTQPSADQDAWWSMPDRVELKVSPEAVAAAQLGMYEVVNDRGGTGNELAETKPGKRSVIIAGKTGTAQAAHFKVPVVDENNEPVLDDNGRPKMQNLTPSTLERPNPAAPWYIGFDEKGENLKHAWVIGFAPAKNPQVAFAVMVEYGGSGGQTAARIARGMLDAAIEHKYLEPDFATTDAR